MTVTFVAASAMVTALNAPVTPTLPTGTAVGDMVYVVAAIRNSGTGIPATPSGWTRTAMFPVGSCVQVFRRVYAVSWTMPAFTFTGGTATDDAAAAAATFRGVADAVAIATTNVLNTSAQNITLPAATTPNRGNTVVLCVAWKQDDWTALGAVAGFTALASAAPTAGSDMGLGWYYQIQPVTAAATPTGAITITGGAAAISWAALGAFPATVTVAAVEQDSWPSRAQITINPLTTGDSVALYRVVAGVRTAVRGGALASAVDPSLVVVDAELPFGTSVSYIAVINGVEYTATTPITYTLVGGKVAVTDAVTGLAAEVVISSWPEKVYDKRASLFRAGGRNVIVSGEWGQFTAAIELFVETTTSSDNLAAVLAGATEGVVQIRQPGGYDSVDCYAVVLSAAVRRHTDRGTDQRRIWALEIAETQAWADLLLAQGYTLGDIADHYGAAGTLADLAADFPTGTLLDIAIADWSS